MTTRASFVKAGVSTLVAAPTIVGTRAFSAPASAAEIQRGGRLLDSLLSEPESLDPHKATLLVSTYVLNLVYDRLVYLDAARKPRPWLAESWTVADGGRKITFVLRDGLKFTDGTPLNAKAVAFTFSRLMSKATASPNARQMGPLDKVEAINDRTVAFMWSKPYAPAFVMLSGSQMGIVSPAGVEKFGPQFGRNPVGSGPFMLKSWDSGKELVFSHNGSYKNFRADVSNGGAPYLDELSIRLVPEEGTRMAALETGELQLGWAPIQDIEKIKAERKLQLFTREKGTSWEYIEFNASAAPFSDIDVRRAVAYAVAPKDILAASYIYGDLIKSPLPIGTTGYDAAIGNRFGFNFDPSKAQSLLRGKQVPPVLLTSWNAPQAVRAVQVIQAQLGALGIQTRLETIDAGTFLAKLRQGNFQFAFNRTTWPDPEILTETFLSPGRDKQFSDPKLDAVLQEITTTVDPAKRQQVVSQAQRLVLEDAACVPLFSDQFIVAARNEVHGYRFDALGLPMYQDVWISKGR